MKKTVQVLLGGIFLISSSALAADAHLTGQASTLVQKSVSAYTQMQSYQSLMQREYPGEGKKSEDIWVRFEKPFAIFMGWKAGPKKGLQIVYARNHFEDKILARPKGFLFTFIPIVHMAKTDPRIGSEEEHSIDTAGIGYMLNDFADDFSKALAEGNIDEISINDVEIDGEVAREVTVVFNDENRKFPKVSMAYSKDHNLPVETIYFTAEGEPYEIYRYLDLKPNSDLNDDANKSAIDHRLHKYLVDIQ
ncbi:MAG: hypothetical protein ACI9CF_000463 [Candidatus Omnitrophota bacterium]|jgi:hypothetical protein